MVQAIYDKFNEINLKKIFEVLASFAQENIEGLIGKLEGSLGTGSQISKNDKVIGNDEYRGNQVENQTPAEQSSIKKIPNKLQNIQLQPGLSITPAE